MDAWEILQSNSTIDDGDGWEHLEAQNKYFVHANGVSVKVLTKSVLVKVCTARIGVKINKSPIKVPV